jgi:hypothetical protein
MKKKKNSGWISVKEEKPKHTIIALVCNEKGFMFANPIRAIYHPYDDVWVLYDLHIRETLTLEITHYLPIPDFEMKK